LRLIFGAAQLRVERIGHAVDRGGFKSRIIQTKTDGMFRKLVRIIDSRWLGVLDLVEPFLLACRHYLAVDQQRGGRFMKHGIDSEDVHPDRPMSRVTLARRRQSPQSQPRRGTPLTPPLSCPWRSA
jgi:hypothetical protein